MTAVDKKSDARPSGATSRADAAEVPATLTEPAPRTLRTLDMAALWGNLGVSLLGFTAAIFVLVPLATPMSLAAAGTALLVGTVLGTLGVAAAALPGQATGAPAMVLLRGLFGTRASYVPTLLNVVQLVGWTTFELVTIGTALHQIAGSVPRWAYILAGGVISTLLALRPLGWIRVLRKYVTVAVVIALAYLFVQLGRHPLPSLTHGSWNGFWIAVDTVVGVSVSWVPLAADYTRHARSARAAFAGTFVGYSITQIVCYALGLVALVTVAHADPNQIFASFMAVPLGTLAFAVLAVRELDQSFADTYSTAVSLQNFRPRWDRRALALVVGALATVCALALNIADFENFLVLIGSVFVPLLGVLVVDYFILSRRRWDRRRGNLGSDLGNGPDQNLGDGPDENLGDGPDQNLGGGLGEYVPVRWAMLAAWALGFVAYQLINPGTLAWWTRGWEHIRSVVHFTPQPWMSASLMSFLVAAIATALIGAVTGEGRLRA